MRLIRPIVWVVVLAVLASPASAFVERKIERSFKITQTASVKVDADSGSVDIVEVSGLDKVEITVRQTADVETEKEMDVLVSLADIEMRQQPEGTVVLSGRFRRPVVWSWQSWPPLSVVYEIRVPTRCDVDIQTGEGRIHVGAITGRVNVKNRQGDIFCGEIDGSIVARSDSGQIGITACTGEMDVRTDSGGITIGRAEGPTNLSSRGGYIDVKRASGQVVIRGSGSDAQVGFVAPIRQPADIQLSGGELFLEVENNSTCTLNLKSSFLGKVTLRGELPLAVTAGGVGRSSLFANVNGGGAVITARAKGGNVRVRSVDPMPSS